MCNLYSLNKKRDAVARFFRVSHNRSAKYEPASAAGHERARRHDSKELVLEAVISGAALPRARVVVLRAQRRCEASDVALVLREGQ